MPINNRSLGSMYIHRDEQARWRWYFYTSPGICFVSQQSYATAEEAVLAMRDCEAE